MKKALVLILIACLTFLIGCSTPKKTLDTAPAKTDSFPVTVIDSTGENVTIKNKPMRIVSLAPSNTEIVFALGAGKRLVGVTEYCNYPASAKQIEKVGGFANPNIEKIISLKPDIVLTGGTVLQDETLARLKDLNILVFHLDAKNITQVMENIDKTGTVLGEMTGAVIVTGAMRAKINDIEDKLALIKTRPSVFYEIYNEPLMTAGPGTFVDDLITRAKGTNVAADSKEEYPQYSLEQMVMANPEVYIAVEGTNSKPGNIKARPGWQQLNAVTSDRIFIVNDDLVSRPGPRIVDGLLAVAKAIHPEAFKQ